MRTMLVTFLATLLLGLSGASAQCVILTGVPFAGEFEHPVKNYNRASDRVATAGELTPEAIAELYDIGFDAIVDVRPAEEQVIRAERTLVEAEGLAYYHLPYTDDGVSEADLATFRALLADPRELRILVHCGQGSRAGAFLASHHLALGADRAFALTAGRAAGLQPDLEAELLVRLDRS